MLFVCAAHDAHTQDVYQEETSLHSQLCAATFNVIKESAGYIVGK